MLCCACSSATASTGSGYPRIPVGPRTFMHSLRAHSSSSKPSKGKKKAAPKPKLSREQLTLAQNTERAVLAYQAMQHYFYIPGSGLYLGEPKYSFLWPFSQALAATVSLSNIQGQTR